MVQDNSKKTKNIAIANQKGGVGKTTTTINLGASLALRGCKVLLIDLDPQGNASTGLGIGLDQRKITTYDVLSGDSTLNDAIQKTNSENLYIIPATTDLSSADIDLIDTQNRSFLLKSVLKGDVFDTFDYVLIDCPPSLNVLTINAMVASDSVLIPLQSEFFALEGLSQLIMTLRDVRKIANRDIKIEGILLTMYDNRNKLSQQVEIDARENLGDLVFKTVIPRNVRLSEAPSYSIPVIEYDSTSKGSLAYQSLANEIINS